MCTESKGLDIVKYLWYNKGLMDKYRPMNEALDANLTTVRNKRRNLNVRS